MASLDLEAATWIVRDPADALLTLPPPDGGWRRPDVLPQIAISPERYPPYAQLHPNAGERMSPETVDAPGSVDTLSALAAWNRWMQANYAPATVRNYWQAVFRFFQANPVPLGEVTEDMVVTWLGNWPYRSSAKRTYYQGLKHFFGFAERRLYVLINPMVHVIVPAVIEKAPRALTPEELELVLNAAASRGAMRRLTILLLYYTGARVGEAVGLAWEDVSATDVLLRHTKNGQERTIPVSPALAEVLALLRDFTGECDLVLDRSKGTVSGWVKQAGHDAGIDWLHTHAMRSTFATTLLNRGARVHTVREMLGHTNLKTTMRYLAVMDEDKREAVALL
jgi:integrase